MKKNKVCFTVKQALFPGRESTRVWAAYLHIQLVKRELQNIKAESQVNNLKNKWKIRRKWKFRL